MNEEKEIIKKIYFKIEELSSLVKGLEAKLSKEDLIPVSEKEEFNILKSLLYSETWPEAAKDDQICNFEDDGSKFIRAENILDIFGLSEPDLKGKRFFDFGCGEGHLVQKAKERGARVSVGFDIKKFDNNIWNKKDIFLTDSWEDINRDVEKNGKYDFVTVYDVIDHIEGDLDNSLARLASVASSLIYVRCHPFCSRHGFHFYNQLNKAFVHLIFSKKELLELGLHQEHHTICLNTPTNFYSVILSNKFHTLDFDVVRTPVEDFIKNNDLIKKRIKNNWYSEFEGDIFEHISCSFVDIILTAKS